MKFFANIRKESLIHSNPLICLLGRLTACTLLGIWIVLQALAHLLAIGLAHQRARVELELQGNVTFIGENFTVYALCWAMLGFSCDIQLLCFVT